MTDTVEKKTRTPKPIAVERKPKVDSIEEQFSSWLEETRCKTISEAEKWIKVNGLADATYRIITIERELTLKVEAKRVATFG